jgi:hypothetical protein
VVADREASLTAANDDGLEPLDSFVCPQDDRGRSAHGESQ